jgi:putative ABC transport system permease protein
MVVYFRLMFESILLALNSLATNKVRTVLSLLGITIGIFSIIAVFSIFDSLERTIKSEISSLGNNVMYIQKWPWSAGGDYPWWKYYQRPEATLDEMDLLQQRSQLAAHFAFMVDHSTTINYEGVSLSATMTGISHDYEQITSFNISDGRYFTHFESQTGANVVILGGSIAENLFPEKDAIGKSVKVFGNKAIIIGVMEKSGGSMVNMGEDQAVYVPVLFARKLLNFRRIGSAILAVAKPEISTDDFKAELTGLMRSIRKQKPTEEDNFSINEMNIISQTFDSFFGIVAIVGWIIGSFALLVGGFGIANIMFVSVKERTNQIGIQKALGAKNYFILFQFLFEAIFLSVMGGVVGLIIVFILAVIVSAASNFAIILSIQNIVLGISVSGFIGLVSGFVPAWSASRLDPVEAMRSNF